MKSTLPLILLLGFVWSVHGGWTFYSVTQKTQKSGVQPDYVGMDLEGSDEICRTAAQQAYVAGSGCSQDMWSYSVEGDSTLGSRNVYGKSCSLAKGSSIIIQKIGSAVYNGYFKP